MHPRASDITGHRFGRLVALRVVGRSAQRVLIWLFRCDCGTEKEIRGSDVRKGYVVSCGCYQAERTVEAKTTHGDNRSREHRIWFGMIQRCTNPHRAAFRYYGGRGISVCDRWRSDYAAFLADVGRAPSPRHSIDRINNDGNYEPGNVRWATASEQNANRRKEADHEAPRLEGETGAPAGRDGDDV